MRRLNPSDRGNLLDLERRGLEYPHPISLNGSWGQHRLAKRGKLWVLRILGVLELFSVFGLLNHIAHMHSQVWDDKTIVPYIYLGGWPDGWLVLVGLTPPHTTYKTKNECGTQNSRKVLEHGCESFPPSSTPDGRRNNQKHHFRCVTNHKAYQDRLKKKMWLPYHNLCFTFIWGEHVLSFSQDIIWLDKKMQVSTCMYSYVLLN